MKLDKIKTEEKVMLAFRISPQLKKQFKSKIKELRKKGFKASEQEIMTKLLLDFLK